MNTEKYKTFAILSEPRTGSTVISNKFGLLEGIHCQGEIFHPDEIYCSVKKESIPNINERNEHPIEFLEKILEQTYLQKKHPGLIGFKLFFDHNTKITQYIIQQKIPVILLERSDKLAQYSSLKIAKKTGKWHSKQVLSKEQEERNKKLGKKIKFSLIEFLAFTIRSHYRFNNIERKFKKYNTPYHYVEYEKMFANNEWENIVRFLNINAPKTDIEPTLEKQNKGSLISRFSNAKYVFFCCRAILLFPGLSKYLSIRPELLEE